MKSKIDLVRAWLKKAENDLLATENSIEAKLYDIASFHAQQCAEKYLKAFLTYHEIEFEKTHAIEDLLLLASQIDDTFAEMIEEGKKLTPYAVEIRYPLLIEEPSEEKAKQLLRIAIKIKELVLNKLQLGEKND